jgi:hypothetical protein
LFFKQEEGVDITANSLHPGAITTNLFRHWSIVNGIHGLFDWNDLSTLFPSFSFFYQMI